MTLGDERFAALVGEAVAVAAEHAAEVDLDGRFPIELLDVLRNNGLLGLVVPTERGGLGGGLHHVVQLAGMLGGVCQASAMVWVMHSQQVDALARYADDELRAELLPRIAAGRLYLGSVTTEPTTGGNLLTSTTSMAAVDGGIRFRREAPVVTGGRHADAFLISLRSGAEAHERDITLLYADRTQVEVEVTGGWDALGIRGVENTAMVLMGRVPTGQAVGGPGRFREIAIECFGPIAFLGWSAAWLGASKAAWSGLQKWSRAARRTADTSSPLFAAGAGRVRSRLEVVGAYLDVVLAEVRGIRDCGGSVDTPATQIHLNTLKLVAAEQCRAAADEMIDLAGLDTGYRRDSPVPLERLLRDMTGARLTYSNRRLLVANGTLSVLDPAITLAGTGTEPREATP